MKEHIRAELLNLKLNGKATKQYKQKLNRLLDTPTITFEDWKKTGTFCNGREIAKMYSLGTLSTHVVRYAGGVIVECVEKNNSPMYTYKNHKSLDLKEIENIVWIEKNHPTSNQI